MINKKLEIEIILIKKYYNSVKEINLDIFTFKGKLIYVI